MQIRTTFSSYGLILIALITIKIKFANTYIYTYLYSRLTHTLLKANTPRFECSD